jgi:hypothetical protein
MAIKRDIKYINRDFADFRTRLIEFAQTYFPTTYNDFTPASPGMMFMEMSAYVGDVLSFYLDNQIQETFIQYAQQSRNLYELAYLLGYKPKTTAAATVVLDVYQQIPATIAGDPDWDYTLSLEQNAVVTSTNVNTPSFLTQNKVDFSVSSSSNPTTLQTYVIDTGTGLPTRFLLKKSTTAISATINTQQFIFTQPQQFSTVNLVADNIIGILDIVDSDGNTWYEVSHLAQDSVFDSVKNTNPNDPNFSTDSNVPYLLQTKQVQRRFATRFLNETTLQLQFGSGTSSDSDEEITPNPDNVGLGLTFEKDKLTAAYSPTNFIFTNTYGIAPSNTTLTVRYLTGGGVSANIPENTLTQIATSNIVFNNATISNTSLANTIFGTLTVNNPEAASGGQDGDSIQEIRQNSLSNFQNQLRTVTSDDYMLRALSIPSIYGTVSKAYAEPTKAGTNSITDTPSSITLYVLSYDSNKKLTTASNTLKQNLRTYLSQYRVLNDSVTIKDAFVINIGVEFEIITYPNYNSNQVLTNCITQLVNFFNIDNWQIDEPIILRDLYTLLDKVEGVQTVKSINVNNLTSTNGTYSSYAYDTRGATVNNVVYPSIDPMIFEVKYPATDIKGKVVSL